MLLSLCACSQENPLSDETTAEATTEEITSKEASLWDNALYTEDKEFGEGEKILTVEVTAEEKTVVFTVKTDESTVGAALLANDLIAGEQGDYGLYVKSVNGIVADYSVDQSYWAFYIGDDYASTGVDSTDIIQGTTYKLVYTK
ncbi:MAG: DUF4430 domain-containing protein [Ruminococcaceae bacterium]|nr:DUF4430 domain-containing protein [Oscillospiraceae bacterium]